MPRQPCPVAGSLVYHAGNRGKNRAGVLFCAADYHALRHALSQTQAR
jgi:hypothetical protein